MTVWPLHRPAIAFFHLGELTDQVDCTDISNAIALMLELSILEVSVQLQIEDMHAVYGPKFSVMSSLLKTLY